MGPAAVDEFLAQVFYRRLDVRAPDTWTQLAKMLGDRPDAIRVFYLAIQPSLFSAACEQLKSAGLNGGRSRVRAKTAALMATVTPRMAAAGHDSPATATPSPARPASVSTT